MTNFPIKDIIYIAGVLLSLGWSAAMYVNHIKHLREDVKEIKEDIKALFSIANDSRDRVSKLEGKWNGK